MVRGLGLLGTMMAVADEVPEMDEDKVAATMLGGVDERSVYLPRC